MTQVSEILSAVSAALLVPDLVALVLLLMWALLLAGGTLREAWERRLWRTRREATIAEARVRAAAIGASAPAVLRSFGRVLAAGRNDALLVERAAEEAQTATEHRLALLTLGARLGPILGLMGTLIPLGPALLALGRGEMEALATNLVVAFATTVIGLLAGSFFFVMAIVRKRWFAQDMADVEFLRLAAEGNGHENGDRTTARPVAARP